MKLAEVSNRRNKRLNKIEQLKLTRSYKEAWEALEYYAKEGYDSIPKEDRDYFLKCFGIFERPATPKKFMMRIRIPAGRLSSKQALVLGKVAREFGNNYMDLTTRAQVQLRYLDIKDIPTLIKRLESVGITSWQTGVDNFRNIVSDPLNGLSYDNIIDVTGLIEQMQNIWLKKDEWISTIPRKFNTSISGSMSNRCNLFAHDCCFALAIKDGEYGFNVYLGGKVGAIAKSADIFVSEDEVIPFYEALIKSYKKYGFRDNRNKNRLHYLIKEAGMRAVIEAVEQEANRSFQSAGECLVKTPQSVERDGKIRLKDGTYALHMVVPSGIFSALAMIDSANLAKEFGNSYLNISTTQNLFILGVKRDLIPTVLSKPPFDKYKNRSSSYFNQLVACAGVDLCPFGVIPNKSDAIDLANFLEKEVPLCDDASIRMHWSACVKGCGVHELGDIGFIGCKVKVDGATTYGVHIQLGGKSTLSQEEAYDILKSIPLTKAKEYVALLAKAYSKLRKPKESFEEFESRVFKRYSKRCIEFILRWSVEVAKPLEAQALNFRDDWEIKEEINEIFTLGLEIYKSLSGVNAYQGVYNYNPIEATPPTPLYKLNSKVSKEVSSIVMKMIAPSTKRYQLFTEILVEVKKLEIA